jgi:hypothetical protein
MTRPSLFTLIPAATALLAMRFKGVCINVWEDSRLGCLGTWPSRLRWRAWRRSCAGTLASGQARSPFYNTAGTATLYFPANLTHMPGGIPYRGADLLSIHQPAT